MTAPAKTSTFRAALIQMRSARSPQANVDTAVKLIGEAKSAGADYVLTPEMTNIMEVRREALFGSIVDEDDDTSLATFRELAWGCEHFGPQILTGDLVMEPLRFEDFHVYMPVGPGIGVVLDEAKLRRYARG